MYWTLFLFFTTISNGAWSTLEDNSYATQAACQAAAASATTAAKTLQPSIKVSFSCAPHSAQ